MNLPFFDVSVEHILISSVNAVQKKRIDMSRVKDYSDLLSSEKHKLL
jgi:hypothetical protein